MPVVRANRLRIPGTPGNLTTVPYENLLFRDTLLSPAVGSSLWESCPLLAIMCDPAVGSHYFEDFLDKTVATTIPGWTLTAATTGSIAISAVAGGVMNISAGAVTAGQGSTFQMAMPFAALGTTKAVWYETYFKFTGLSATPKFQFFAGLATAGSTALITSNALDTTINAIGFYGVTTAGAVTATTTASSTNTTPVAAFTVADTVWYKVGFYATPSNVDFWVGGTKVTSITTNIPATALSPVFVCQGNATVTPVLNVDYLRVACLR